jgi:hypothetical protein
VALGHYSPLLYDKSWRKHAAGNHVCEKDTLAIYLIERKTWPYHDVPFTGYWDNYDNKLASIVAEPYSRVALAMAMTCVVWFRVVIYIRKRYGREQTVTPKQEQQQ